MEYLVDAHALLWHLYSPQRIGEAARKVLSDIDANRGRALVPAVVISEVIMVVQKGRLPGASIEHLITVLRTMATSENYILSTLEPETVIASHTTTAIPDIFDRLIVTEAILRNIPVLTRDRTIVASGLIETIWD